MTKEELRSRVKNRLLKIDKSNSWHELVIDHAIEEVLNTKITEVFLAGGNLEPFMKRYGDAVPLAVNTDATTLIDYTTLPVICVPLMDKAGGVRHIYTQEMGGAMFYPMDSREMDLVNRNTYFSLITNKIGYVVYPEKVEYFNMQSGIRTLGVRMDLIPCFTQYADTEVVNVPSNASAEFVKEVATLLLENYKPADLKDNNTNNEE
jgi:hypothetical protein